MKFLYLCISGDWLKFGVAIDIKNRFNQYKTHNPNFDFHAIWQGKKEDIDQFENVALNLLDGLERKSDWAKLHMESDKLKSIINLLDSFFDRYSHQERDFFAEWVTILTPLINDNVKFIKANNLIDELDKLGYLNFTLKKGKYFHKAISYLGFYRTTSGFKRRKSN